MGYVERDLTKLGEYCTLASEACGVPVPANYPVLGRDAFRTATGVHAAAVIKAIRKRDESLTDAVYSSVPAHMVGREQEIEVGPMSGKSNVVYWLEKRRHRRVRGSRGPHLRPGQVVAHRAHRGRDPRGDRPHAVLAVTLPSCHERRFTTKGTKRHEACHAAAAACPPCGRRNGDGRAQERGHGSARALARARRRSGQRPGRSARTRPGRAGRRRASLRHTVSGLRVLRALRGERGTRMQRDAPSCASCPSW